ncbi:hypothetical protein B0H13DRAFT_2311337 [Mycena leptocephala]|nr:hypothetical protein B0H13DRAFT_2311337 [Mycena leptocephala]
MAFSKRHVAILVFAAVVLYLGRSMDFGSAKPEGHFRGYSTERPPSTAAVVYLVSVLPGPRNPDELLGSLPLMQRNIPWRHQLPVLLLHVGAYDTPESQVDFWKLLKRIEFVPTYHELPEGIPVDGAGDGPIFRCQKKEFSLAAIFPENGPPTITCARSSTKSSAIRESKT